MGEGVGIYRGVIVGVGVKLGVDVYADMGMGRG